ncbi:YciI family protein [Devosia algicola]|uniref:YciI family protein n=1 Tax=Devosia algicola TaxID=3026418 RepID=A0ABY7YKM4_9HYPH|nr:YciI family protein [Devosia algicola]WDR01737.1 YciI family protein [Devosia algicola]
MLYAIIARDKPNNVDRRKALRPTHLEHLKSAGDQIVCAGALYDESDQPSGSLVVIEAADLGAAKALAAADPFVTEGVFDSYEVIRWNWAINNPTGRGQ